MVLRNKHCPFRFWNWQTKKIIKIYAGNSCVMAINADGKVFQKVLDEKLAARTEYWNNMKSIAISQMFPALAIGLAKDGSCMASKRALRHCCAITGRNFDTVNEQIRSLKGIVELAVSDAVFALDRFGRVHHIPLWKEDVYAEVSTWRNVRHIAVANQDAVFGITESGSIECAGANISNGLDGNRKDALASFKNAVDICALGSECEKIMIALSDGRTVDYNGGDLKIEHSGIWPVFTSNSLLTCIRSEKKSVRCIAYGSCGCKDAVRKLEKSGASDIAIGMDEKFFPFVVWVKS